MEKRVYVVPFEITGDMEFEATSEIDAQRQADRLTLVEIAKHGELWTGEPRLKEEMVAARKAPELVP